ncbi:hypothetical protein [Streptomyces sp. NPDC002855]|uniref:hypothetical protein n=1 Tax=Streptomyces sp. NPDC002855 TaxID=3154437 RepID=UPI0033340BD3
MSGSVGNAIGARIGEEIGRQIARHVTAQISGSLRDGITQGGAGARAAATRQGDATAGAFARAARTRLETAFRSLPRLDVGLSTTGADADLARLRARLESLSSKRVGVDIDAETARREITDIEERLQRVGANHPNVTVRADTAAAAAQLAALRGEIDGLDGRDIDIDTTPVVRSFSNMVTAAAAFGPAVIPAIAAATVAVGALGSAFFSAAGGAGVFFLAVKPQLEEIKNAQKLHVAYAAAVDKSGKDSTAAKNALEKYKTALHALPPASEETLNALDGLKAANQRWSDSLAKTTMPVFTKGLNLAAASLPKLTPLVKVAAGAFDSLLSKVAGWVKGGGLDRLVAWLTKTAGPQIRMFGKIAANIFGGIGGIMRSFTPTATAMSQSLVGVTGRFREWGQSGEGVRSLLAYVRTTGPGVSQALGNIGGAALNLLAALVPMAGTATAFINAIASGIRMIPVPVLATLGVAFASIAIGAKLAALAMGAWKIAQTAAAITTAVLTRQTWALNTAMRANLIGAIITLLMALVVAIIYAWHNSQTFRNVVMSAWNGIKTAASVAWSVLRGIFSGLVTAVRAVGSAAMWLWRNAIGPAFRAISTAARILFTAVVVVMILPVILYFKLLGKIGQWLWRTAIGPAFRGIASLAKWVYNNGIKPAFSAAASAFRALGSTGRWLYNSVIKPVFSGIRQSISAFGTAARGVFRLVTGSLRETLGPTFRWLRDSVVKPVFNGIRSTISTVYNNGIKPVFNALKSAVGQMGKAFNSAKNAIKTAWDKIKGIVKAPIKFVINTVYNGGIVPVWNKVASAFGAPPLKEFHPDGFARGGILPGYTPGRDPHKFFSPTGGALEMSGGEAIMRPEFTRAVGAGFVGSMNRIASTKGARGVKAALAPVFGGNPDLPTDTSLRYANGGVLQKFADGGIFGWIGKGLNAAAGVGSAAWNKVKEGAAWLKDTLAASARAGVKNVVDPLLKSFPGMDTKIGKMIRGMPTKIIDWMFGYSEKADKKGAAGGVGGPGIQKALKWAKTQHGKPYQWAGNGNPSWDCSGFMSAIESVIRGQKPHRRWATMAFAGKQAPPGWVYHGNSKFRVGITNAGVGHTAGTLGKTNVESRGGDGVVVGSRARGYSSSMFGNSWYGFSPGKYDSGGYLQPGLNLAYNGTGRPEPVFTSTQASALTSLATAGGGIGDLQVSVYVGNEEITDIARTEVHRSNGELISALGAGRR